MATKTTKTKIKDSLKNVFINEMKTKKEEERLERVKSNSILRNTKIYTDKTLPICKQITDILINEGIPFTEIEISENSTEWKEVAKVTNFGVLPTILVNGDYLAYNRDFQHAQQVTNMVTFLADPLLKEGIPNKIIETQKTANYNMFSKMGQLEQSIKPLISFITNLQKELEEEDDA